MNDQSHSAIDNIPVLSHVVIPGILHAAPDPEPVPEIAPQDNPLTERLKAQADILLAELHERIERLVEEELARAHSSALETARQALQQRLRAEMEERLNAFIADALQPHDS
jgi:broad specificity phosphatase PhoE